MVVARHRGTKITVDLGAIKANIRTVLHTLPADQKLFAVVKANAYGHGLVPVAYAAKEAGAAGFCVAVIDEGVALREAGLNEPILILGVNPVTEAPYIAANDLSVAVGSLEFLQEALPLLAEQGLRLNVHLALDTGMGRIGFRQPEAVRQAEEFMRAHAEQFRFEGVFTHFATADMVDTTYFNHQKQAFYKLVGALDELPPYVHVTNSAASLWHQQTAGNMIRFGIAMYGLNPSGREMAPTYALRPALSLTSEVVHVKKITAGDSVGYGKTYTAGQDEWIGTVPMGYADGWLRRLQGFKVLVDGEECEIVGRVCMDQFMIRLPHAVKLGTKVTLIGRDGDAQITAQDVADYVGTIHYEILCGLSHRVPRVYRD
ncbi:MAG TPA: alanine racemase [Ligilactobacillus saerimneri]|nr:alanine racemase [Ligilactobacillus saerimneri]